MKSPIKTLCCVLFFLCLATEFSNASQFWVGVDSHNNVSTNWSDFNNWTVGGPPLGTGGAVFSNDVSAQAASPFSVVGDGPSGITTFANFNNVVDFNFFTNAAFSNGVINSLQYTNVGMFQNTYISTNVILTVSNGLTVGNTSVDFGASPVINVTIAGLNGALRLPNSSESMFVVLGSGAAGNHEAILDMSGLGSFNASISHLAVGVAGSEGVSQNRANGILYLALTNVISASLSTNGMETSDGGTDTPIDVADAVSNGGGLTSFLYLGATNLISADGIGVGRQKDNGTIEFNPNLTTNGFTPSVYFRGFSTNIVENWSLGDGVANSGTTTCTGTADFTTNSGGCDGYVNALVGAMFIGRAGANASGGGTATGILTFDNGVFDVNNISLGLQPTSNSAGKAGHGTINVGAAAPPATIGTLSISGNLNMANTTGGTSAPSTAGTLNITGGTVDVNAIVPDPNKQGVSTITNSGGLLVVSNTMGTLAGPLSSLTLNSGATLQLSVTNNSTNAEVSAIASDNTAVINISALPEVHIYPSQFPVLGYASGGSGHTFATGTLPGIFQGYVSNDNTATIWVVITNGPPIINAVWTGLINNNWDTNTLNWTTNGVASTYHEGDATLFNDTASTASVNLPAAHQPISWTITNNTLNYTFSGAGSISGTTALIMNGTARATLAETGGDSFFGGIQINLGGTVVLDDPGCAISGGAIIASGGTLQIGNSDTNGALPSGVISDAGAIIFDQTANNLVATAIAGTGGITQNGNSVLTLNGVNTYTGNTVVNAGTLALTNSGSIAGSAQVSVTSATLDVSGVTVSTTLNALNLGNATLNIKVGYIQTNLIVSSLSMSGAASTINVMSLPPVASYPTTLTLISAPGGISGYNFALGSLPAGFVGNISQVGNNVVLTLASGPISARPYVLWGGGDIVNLNTNWSDATNWLSAGAPLPSDNVVINETDEKPGSAVLSLGGGQASLNFVNVNNIVNGNFTISTLIYTNVDGSWQNTYINDGDTLTITNSGTNTILSIGSPTADFGSSASEFVSISGPDGTLNVNNTNDTIFVGLVDSANTGEQVTLDMSALGTFDATVGIFEVGALPTTALDTAATIYLAQTNNITALGGTNNESGQDETLSFVVGQTGKNGGPNSFMYLGQQNTINANYIGVGIAKQNAVMEFNPIQVNPTATFHGGDGISPVNVWAIGDALAQTGSSTSPNATADFTANFGGAAGTVNALVTTMYIGRSPNVSGGRSATGTLSFGAGTISVGTLYDGYQAFSQSDLGDGTVNVDGPGTLQIGTLYLALTTGGTGAAGTLGALNISGGAVEAGTIIGDTNTVSPGQSTISLTAGTLVISNTCTLRGSSSSLSLSAGTTLELDVNGSANVTNIVATTVSASATVTLQIASLTGVNTSTLYPLISYTGGDPYSSLNLVLPAGYTGNLVDNTASSLVQLQLTTVPVTTPPHITSISISGSTLTFSATNGMDGGPFTLLESTNLLLPIAQWTPVFTNSFNGSGAVSLSTNVVNPNTPDEFYLIKEP